VWKPQSGPKREPVPPSLCHPTVFKTSPLPSFPVCFPSGIKPFKPDSQLDGVNIPLGASNACRRTQCQRPPCERAPASWGGAGCCEWRNELAPTAPLLCPDVLATPRTPALRRGMCLSKRHLSSRTRTDSVYSLTIECVLLPRGHTNIIEPTPLELGLRV